MNKNGVGFLLTALTQAPPTGPGRPHAIWSAHCTRSPSSYEAARFFNDGLQRLSERHPHIVGDLARRAAESGEHDAELMPTRSCEKSDGKIIVEIFVAH